MNIGADPAKRPLAPTAAPGSSHTLLESVAASGAMILCTEIGDKTFFIACLMAMRYSRYIVYLGALSALIVMTVLSTLLGLWIPNVLSVVVTKILAGILFIFFGAYTLWETYHSAEEDEIGEAAAVLNKKENNIEKDNVKGRHRFFSLSTLVHPVFIEAFVLTFFAEWGDRSQLATILLAAAQNPYGVALGGILGHAICTGMAVCCGHYISSLIGKRTIGYIGGILFIFFGFLLFFQLGTYKDDISNHHKLKK